MSQPLTVLGPPPTPGFADQLPVEIYAALLDEGIYNYSILRTYRLLDQNSEIRERRKQLHPPADDEPELLAQQSNEV